jgi:hypothetical protein
MSNSDDRPASLSSGATTNSSSNHPQPPISLLKSSSSSTNPAQQFKNNEFHHTSSSSTSSTPSTPSTTIHLEEFQRETCENLFKFKNESLFTDVHIYVEGVEFACHKVILCAASAYFRAMFSCDLKEARHGKVYIENISPWTMKRLLDFIYTGRIEINAENVIDLFNAALLFQMHKLVDKCIGFIEANVDLNNCVEINLFASMHSLEGLENSSFKFILENFMQLVNLSISLAAAATNGGGKHGTTSSNTSSSPHHHQQVNTPTSLMNTLFGEDCNTKVASNTTITTTASASTSNTSYNNTQQFGTKVFIV